MAQRLSTWERDPNYPKGHLGGRHHQILEAVARCEYLLPEQVNALIGYSPSSVQKTRKLLQELWQWEYLRRRPLPKPFGKGQPDAVSSLDNLGYRYLRGLGLEPPGRFRASEEPGDFFLKHTLASNQMIVLAHQFVRDLPQVGLLRYLSELELSHKPISLPPGIQRASYAADGFVELLVRSDVGQLLSVPLLLEVDRNTEGVQVFRNKVARLVAATRGPLQREFGIQSGLLVFLAAEGGTRRLEQLVRWTEAELKAHQAQEVAVLFRFQAFDPFKADPELMFTAPVWRVPFAEVRQPLLPKHIGWAAQ